MDMFCYFLCYCFVFIHINQVFAFIAEKGLTHPCIHPNIRPPLKRPYRLEA